MFMMMMIWLWRRRYVYRDRCLSGDCCDLRLDRRSGEESRPLNSRDEDRLKYGHKTNKQVSRYLQAMQPDQSERTWKKLIQKRN